MAQKAVSNYFARGVEMKKWFERLGCLVWVLTDIGAGCWAGWTIYNDTGIGNLSGWLGVTISVLVGLAVLIVFAVTSMMILIMNNKEGWEEIRPGGRT